MKITKIEISGKLGEIGLVDGTTYARLIRENADEGLRVLHSKLCETVSRENNLRIAKEQSTNSTREYQRMFAPIRL